MQPTDKLGNLGSVGALKASLETKRCYGDSLVRLMPHLKFLFVYVLMCGSACSLHLYHIVYKHLPAPMTYMGDYGELDKPPSADL